MNIFKKLGLAAVMAAALTLAPSARAQVGFDIFGGTRTAVLQQPTNILFSAGGTNMSNPVDIRLFTGVALLNIHATTNQAGGTITANIASSPDLTNWTALANYALATPTSVIYANTFYGTGTPIATNIWLLPGTVTTPVAATAGFATPYLVPAPFTNSGAITVNPNGITSIGLNIDDAGRYLKLTFTGGGTTTNFSASATVTGKLHVGAGGI